MATRSRAAGSLLVAASAAPPPNGYPNWKVIIPDSASGRGQSHLGVKAEARRGLVASAPSRKTIRRPALPRLRIRMSRLTGWKTRCSAFPALLHRLPSPRLPSPARCQRTFGVSQPLRSQYELDEHWNL